MSVSLSLRSVLRNGDPEAIYEITESTEFFRPDELVLPKELASGALKKPKSNYNFFIADVDGKPAGYACYSTIPSAIGSYNLHWLVVHRSMQGKGLGKILLKAVEDAVKQMNARHLYLNTSDMGYFLPTRLFYESKGYTAVAHLPKYYTPEDGLIIYRKVF